LLFALLAQGAMTRLPAGAPFPVSLTVSPDIMAFDEGLDARDAHGRTVASPAAKRELRQLFVSSLYLLLMRPELPAMAEALSVLQKTWNLASGVFGRAAAAFWTFALDVWSPSTKRWRFVPSLALLAVLGVVFVQSFIVLRAVPRTDSHLKSLATSVIRC
jgi:hypothetical protein